MKKSPGPPLVEAPRYLRSKLAELCMTQADFAKRMGLSKKQVNEVVQGYVCFSAIFAIYAERVLSLAGVTAGDLMRLQYDEELYRARVRMAERARDQ